MLVKILLNWFRWLRMIGKLTLLFIVVMYFVTLSQNIRRLNRSDMNTQCDDTKRPSNKYYLADWNSKATWAPFKDVSVKNAKLVVLLSYQRSGSTLLGHLFNNHSDVFYQFEPLDSLYSSMYGTLFGWNVPSDITGHKNGSLRIPPKSESDQVSLFLRRLLTCDMESLPTTTLIHQFQFDLRYHFRSSNSYISCLKDNVPFLTDYACYKSVEIKKLCGLRFGGGFEDQQLDCNRLLLNPDDKTINASEVVRMAFRQRQLCERRERKLIDKRCSSRWLNACQKREIRAVKVVRATMHSMKELLHSFDNLRIIHLFRDPRGVTLSRSGFDPSSCGSYADGPWNKDEKLIREAKLYCQTVAEDIRIRHELQRRYPGRILTIVYDHMATDIRGYIQKIYRFLDLPNDGLEASYEALRVQVSLFGESNDTPSSEQIAGKWKSELTFDVCLKILEVCHDFFELANDYEWSEWKV